MRPARAVDLAFTRRDLTRCTVKPAVQAKRVLDFVDEYRALTGLKSGVLHLWKHHWDWLNNALLRGSNEEMNLTTHDYKGFTLRRAPPTHK